LCKRPESRCATRSICASSGAASWRRCDCRRRRVCRRRSRLSGRGYERRTQRRRGLSGGSSEQRRSSSAMLHHAPNRGTRPESKRHTDQEQIQIIATAIGTPNPSAPKIASTNSESRFAWCRTPGVDMTLLLGAPRASTRPQDERSICAFGPKPVATLQWGNAGAVMVNKWLTTQREVGGPRLEARHPIVEPSLRSRFGQSSNASPASAAPLARPGRRQGMAPSRRHSLSAAHANQNEQP